MSLTRMFGVTGLCTMLLSIAGPAMAQGAPKAEVSGGYNYLRASQSGDDTSESFPKGWYADVAGNLSSMFGVVGQVTGNYKTIDDADIKVHSFLFGVRAMSHANPMVVPFGQVLFGGARISAKAAVAGGTFNVSETDGAVQVGAGVNLMPASKVGVRVGVDYLRVFAKSDGNVLEGNSVNGLRFALGVVFGL